MSNADTLVDTLVAAFWDDPFYRWLFDRADRASALRDNFDVVMGFAHDRACVERSTDGLAVAVWTDPDQTLMDDTAPLLGVLARWAPHRVDAAVHGLDACAVHRPGNAHVLHLIGVHPDVADRGVGSHLLAPRLAAIDDTGGIAYLESSSWRNHAFYRRLGFRRLAEVTIGDGPSMWPMSRPPHHVGSGT